MITQILAKVLPVLVMIILGRVCATKGILNGEQHAGLKNVIGDILLPVVLFQAFFTADYGKRMLLVFVLVFVGYGAALAAGYALRRFVKPYGRFMPLLMTNAEGGMLGYALYALLCGADQTKMYAMVDIGQTVFGFTVFLTALKAAGGEKMTPKFIVKNMLTNKACIGMLLGIILGALGVHKAIDGTAAGEIVTSLLSFITAPTSALILIVMGYQLHVSKKLLRPVLTTMGLRLGVLAVVCAAAFCLPSFRMTSRCCWRSCCNIPCLRRSSFRCMPTWATTRNTSPPCCRWARCSPSCCFSSSRRSVWHKPWQRLAKSYGRAPKTEKDQVNLSIAKKSGQKTVRAFRVSRFMV